RNQEHLHVQLEAGDDLWPCLAEVWRAEEGLPDGVPSFRLLDQPGHAAEQREGADDRDQGRADDLGLAPGALLLQQPRDLLVREWRGMWGWGGHTGVVSGGGGGGPLNATSNAPSFRAPRRISVRSTVNGAKGPRFASGRGGR